MSFVAEADVWFARETTVFPGRDTLPAPMNLAQWNISLICSLCSSSQPITNYILTSCTTTLDQGRYTWHRDSVLKAFCQWPKEGITILQYIIW